VVSSAEGHRTLNYPVRKKWRFAYNCVRRNMHTLQAFRAVFHAEQHDSEQLHKQQPPPPQPEPQQQALSASTTQPAIAAATVLELSEFGPARKSLTLFPTKPSAVMIDDDAAVTLALVPEQLALKRAVQPSSAASGQSFAESERARAAARDARYLRPFFVESEWEQLFSAPFARELIPLGPAPTSTTTSTSSNAQPSASAVAPSVEAVSDPVTAQLHQHLLSVLSAREAALQELQQFERTHAHTQYNRPHVPVVPVFRAPKRAPSPDKQLQDEEERGPRSPYSQAGSPRFRRSRTRPLPLPPPSPL
jgi:hypothetical protein